MSVPYLRARRGYGKLYDDAEANRNTYISKDSSASGMAKLRDCRLVQNSHAKESCQVYGGQYLDSTIMGNTICAGDPRVFHSTLRCSEVSGTPQIWNSDILGTTEICDSPAMNGIIARDAIIYGSPKITGTFTITGRIHEGVWLRPPKHIRLPWCDLSECIDGKVLLNCYCRKAEFWIRHGARVAAKWDWSPEMVEITMHVIRREFLVSQSAIVIYTPEHGESIPLPSNASSKEAP